MRGIMDEFQRTINHFANFFNSEYAHKYFFDSSKLKFATKVVKEN